MKGGGKGEGKREELAFRQAMMKVGLSRHIEDWSLREKGKKSVKGIWFGKRARARVIHQD